MQASKVHLWIEASVYKKVSRHAIVFLVLYVDNILLIGNDVSVLQSIKI